MICQKHSTIYILLISIFIPIFLAAHLNVAVIDDCLKLRLNEPIPKQSFIFNAETAAIQIYGAGNEIVSFQIVLSGDTQEYKNMTLKATPLRSRMGKILGENIEFFREWYLNVTEPSTEMYGKPSSRGPGWYPDPLLPFHYHNQAVGAPFNLKPAARQTIWVDLHIPQFTPAGEYNGEIEIINDEALIALLNLKLTVWNFTLSDSTHLKTFFYFGPEQLRLAHQAAKDSPQAEKLNLAYMRMAHKHRINLATDISVTTDWSYFDANWKPYLDGTAFIEAPGRGIGCSLWPVNLSIWDGATQFQTQARQVMEYFYQQGWMDKAFLYVIDEPGPGQYPEVRKVGEWLDDAPYPGNLLPFMLTEHLVPELVGYVDIWNSQRIKKSIITQRSDADDQFWTYNGSEPGAGSQCIDTDGWAMRSWPWVAWKGQRAAWHYWDCCYFKDRANKRGEIDVWQNSLTFDQRPQGDVDWGNGDGTLFYPGQQFAFGRNFLPGPVSSIRMKAFRRGQQDYEYLWLAAQLTDKEQVNSIVQSILPNPVLGDALPGKTCYVKSAMKWHLARVALAELILAAQKD